VLLEVDTAVPCALVVNELVTNALKHAFPDGASGAILVQARVAEDGYVTVTVRDNGTGMRQDAGQRAPRALGLRLVDALVRQVRGRLEASNSDGATFTLTFPSSERHSTVGRWRSP